MKSTLTPRPWLRLLALAIAALGLASCEVYPVGYGSAYGPVYRPPVCAPVPVCAPIPVCPPVRPWGGYYGGGYGRGGWNGGGGYRGYGYGNHHGHCY